MTAIRSLIQHRRWRWRLASTVLTQAAELLAWYAVIAFVAGGDETEQGAYWLSAILMARVVPAIVLGPLGGTIVDSTNRRRLLAGLDLFRALATLGMAAVIGAEGSRTLVVLFIVVTSVAGTIARSATVAVMPMLLLEDEIGIANTVESAVAHLSFLAFPALGVGLLTTFEPATVLVSVVILWIASSLCASRIGDVGGTGNDPEKSSQRNTRPQDSLSRNFSLSRNVWPKWNEFVKGFVIIGRDRGLMALVALVSAEFLAFGAQQVLYVLVARDRLDLGSEGVGLLVVFAGLGGLVAAPFVVRLSTSSQLGLIAGVSAVATTAPLAFMAFVDSRPVAFALMFIEGLTSIVFDIAALTLLQRAVAENALGRVSGLQDSVGSLGQVLGSALVPVLVGVVGLGPSLATFGFISMALTSMTIPPLIALGSKLELRRRESRDLTVWLGGLAPFVGMDVIGCERLARSSVEMTVRPGEVVIMEGENPDDVFAIRSGRLGVTIADEAREIPEMKEGDVFGEIGLLRGVPRTATVTALSDCSLVRIDGRVFRSVLVGKQLAIDPIVGGMHVRLGRTHPHLVAAANLAIEER